MAGTSTRRAVFPGSFDPLTIAHLTIADAVVAEHGVDRLDLVISQVALAKEDRRQSPVEVRLRTIRSHATSRPWLDGYTTDRQLLVDIARGYDLLVVGADKWHQLHDVRFYEDDTHLAESLEALPHLVVAPRAGVELPDHVTVLDVPDEIADVSSTGVRRGRDEWRA